MKKTNHKKYKPTAILAIDFDGVVHDYKNPVEGRRMGPPFPDAEDALTELSDQGYRIIIHTVKAVTDAGKQVVIDWLDYYGLPYDEVTAIKPTADHYIDDRAIRHISWSDTLQQIEAIKL